MGKQDIHEYHRTFLSPDYSDNLRLDDVSYWVKEARKARENSRLYADMVALRERDLQAWEKVRMSIAPLFKVQYASGYWVGGARGDLSGSSSPTWIDGQPSDYIVAECMDPLIPRQGLVTNPITGEIALPASGFHQNKAFIEAGQHLEEVTISDKEDQDFEKYATPWELKWSNLSAPYNRGFTPIVNRSYTVVGHWGTVIGGIPSSGTNGPIFIAPKAFSGPLDATLKLDIPTVFITSSGGIPEGYEAKSYFTTEHRIEVRTGPDGEVLNTQVSTIGSLEQPWFSPMDLYNIAKVMVSLAKVGTKLTLALAKKAVAKFEARAVLSGPTKMLAQEAEAALSGTTSREAAASSTGRALGAQDVKHFGRRTLIMGEDMATFESLMARSHSESGFYDVMVHGDENSFAIMVGQGARGEPLFKNVSAREVADAVRPRLQPGDRIRLLSCETGNSGGPAQEIADILDREVWAPTTSQKAVPGSRGTFVPNEGGTFNSFRPRRGSVTPSGGGGNIVENTVNGEISRGR